MAWANRHFHNTALTLYKSRRAIYTCPARLHLSLVHPRRLFRQIVPNKAGPLIKTSPPLSHHSPLLATKKASHGGWRWPWEKEQVFTENGLLPSIRMPMRIFCQIMFPQRSTTWLPLAPSSYSVSPSCSASCPIHPTCPFHPFQSKSPIHQFMGVMVREWFQGLGRELGVP